MKNLYRVVLAIFLIFTTNSYSQIYETLKNSADEYIISLSQNSTSSKDEFKKLKQNLFNEVNENLLSEYQTTPALFDSLRNSFLEYEKIVERISSDSALVLFNQSYLQFCNTFYNYAEEKFFSSNKVKLLLFSASVSCACTLEMCRNQTVEIIRFAKENGYEYWIVDSYENNQLQLEYETLFAPSVIVFDENNNVLSKIEYDKKMITKLSEFLVNHRNKKLRG